MSNATAEDFRRSLDQLVAQAQQTAQLGVTVAREQVESFVKNPNVSDQFEEVRKNLQTMAREIETKAQELVHLASSYVQPGGPLSGGASGPRTTVTTEPPSGNEAHTAAGAGTAQHGSDHTKSSHTPAGEAPHQ
jgi:ElaB/YqjD/DUF883 family membrane-anchored ribosome-binding protein